MQYKQECAIQIRVCSINEAIISANEDMQYKTGTFLEQIKIWNAKFIPSFVLDILIVLMMCLVYNGDLPHWN